MNQENKQGELEFGRKLRDQGIQKALDHADQTTAPEKWTNIAYKFFEFWIGGKPPKYDFQIEEFREDSEKLETFPHPPSRRAFGALALRAVKNGLIYPVGFRSVTNSKAHCALCRVWRKF